MFDSIDWKYEFHNLLAIFKFFFDVNNLVTSLVQYFLEGGIKGCNHFRCNP